MSFATPADLAAYLQRTDLDMATAELALDIASATVTARTGQDFVETLADTVTLETHGTDVRLPQRPVLAVASVTTRDLGSPAVTTRTLNVEYERRGDLLRWVGGGAWPYEVTVTYSHGYATIPNDVRGATLAVAAEIVVNPEALASGVIDDSTDKHEWASDSPAEKMLKLVERRYGRKPLTVRLR